MLKTEELVRKTSLSKNETDNRCTQVSVNSGARNIKNKIAVVLGAVFITSLCGLFLYTSFLDYGSNLKKLEVHSDVHSSPARFGKSLDIVIEDTKNPVSIKNGIKEMTESKVAIVKNQEKDYEMNRQINAQRNILEGNALERAKIYALKRNSLQLVVMRSQRMEEGLTNPVNFFENIDYTDKSLKVIEASRFDSSFGEVVARDNLYVYFEPHRGQDTEDFLTVAYKEDIVLPGRTNGFIRVKLKDNEMVGQMAKELSLEVVKKIPSLNFAYFKSRKDLGMDKTAELLSSHPQSVSVGLEVRFGRILSR